MILMKPQRKGDEPIVSKSTRNTTTGGIFDVDLTELIAYNTDQ
jgi:hypothetical protein